MQTFGSLPWIVRVLLGSACLTASAGGLGAQSELVVPLPQTDALPQHDSRIFGFLPNYRTIPESRPNVKPLSAAEKWRLAGADSFDRGTILLAGAMAGIGQAEHQYPSWGQGSVGYGKRFGAAFANQAVGDYMTEAIFPILFREDPRYFRMGHGSLMRRFGYAVGRIPITRTDSGLNRTNYSELLGNAAAAGIANTYLPVDERTAANAIQQFGMQLATDALGNVLKEFWPDLRRKLSRHPKDDSRQTAALFP